MIHAPAFKKDDSAFIHPDQPNTTLKEAFP